MDPILGGFQAGLAAMEGIQRLNEGAHSEKVEEEVVDPEQDPNLTKVEPGHANQNQPGASLSIGLRFTVGNVNIGFMLHLTKQQGKENAPEIGLEAQDEHGQTMRGVLGELPEQDKQDSFTPEAWGKVQEKRQLCIETAEQGLKALSGKAEKSLSK